MKPSTPPPSGRQVTDQAYCRAVMAPQAQAHRYQRWLIDRTIKRVACGYCGHRSQPRSDRGARFDAVRCPRCGRAFF